MNLSPVWIPMLAENGIEAVHWSQAGPADAPDSTIFSYAQAEHYVVFTHDLDFGDILAATGAASPSVIQLRSEDTSPDAMMDLLVNAVKQFRSQLESVALITIDAEQLRARILPIEKDD